MATTLYRKYRPKLFAELIGQQHIRVTLLNELSSGRIAHAYLFTGPRGIGKTTVARLLARAVNCEQRQGAEPDNRCSACREILDGRSLDIIEVDAASQTGVDNVRENIIANARVAPSRLRYKVFIIDEVHMLSIGAFNALLKMLEEPPSHALFILATTEVHKVPETIISRCQRFDFHRVTVDDIKKRLATLARAEEVAVDDAVLEDIARRAEGSVRDAESLLGQLLALGERTITIDQAAIVLPRTNVQSLLDFFNHFARQDITGALAQLNELVDQGVSLPHFVHQFVELLRAVLLLKVNPSMERSALLTLDANQERELLAQLPSLTIEDLVRFLEVFHDVERMTKVESIAQLPVELAIFRALPTAQPTTSSAPAPRHLKRAVAEPPKPDRKRKAAATTALPDPPVVGVATLEHSWNEIIQATKKVNHAIALLLKTAVPADVTGQTVVIGVRFPFHAERLMEAKNRRQLEEVLSQVVGVPLTIRCSVVPATASGDDGMIGDIAKALGGEVL